MMTMWPSRRRDTSLLSRDPVSVAHIASLILSHVTHRPPFVLYLVCLLAVSPEFILFLNQGPAWAYEQCLESLQLVLNPLVSELPYLNRTADEHITVTYTLFFGP